MRRFFAAPENFKTDTVWLAPEEARHLRDVLRLRETEEVAVFNGKGLEYLCEIEKLGRGNEPAHLGIKRKIASPALESNLELTLGLALLKGEKFDLVVQKATELGVNSIVPLQTKRAEMRLKEAKEISKKLERWRRITLEAAKQSGRAVVPFVEKPIDLSHFLQIKNGEEVRVFFAERAGLENFENLTNEKVSKAIAVVGAEGGWEDLEIELAIKNDFKIMTLGSRILRAETAAIVAVTLMQHRFGDLS